MEDYLKNLKKVMDKDWGRMAWKTKVQTCWLSRDGAGMAFLEEPWGTISGNKQKDEEEDEEAALWVKSGETIWRWSKKEKKESPGFWENDDGRDSDQGRKNTRWGQADLHHRPAVIDPRGFWSRSFLCNPLFLLVPAQEAKTYKIPMSGAWGWWAELNKIRRESSRNGRSRK